MLPLLAAILTLAGAPPDVAQGAMIVRAGPSIGSGVVWDAPAHRVLTTLHLVEAASAGPITVLVPGRGAVLADVVEAEPSLDLALLQVAAELEPGPILGVTAALAPGDPVSLPACGTRGRAADRGSVIAPSRAFAGSIYLAVRAAVAPGWSGRPVLDARGALVGIVDLALLREPGTALAVPIERAAARFPRP